MTLNLTPTCPNDGASLMLDYGEVCAGVLGIGLGLERAGMHGRWAIEIDPACQRVIKKNRPDLEVFGDVTGVKSDSLRRVKLVAGGTPCTNLSVAGQRVGLAGDESRLFFEFTRIITDLAPSWILWENVPGVLSTNNGEDFAAVLGHLTGYFPTVPQDGWRNSGICNGPAYKVAWRVLDTQHFGTPQRRKRVFVVGHIGDPTAGAAVLLKPEDVLDDLETSKATSRQHPRTLEDSPYGAGFTIHSSGAVAPRIAHTLTTRGFERQDHTMATFLPERTDDHGWRVRQLTPLECERLQAWPDNWTEGESPHARYRFTGNGVSSNVSEWIGKRIVQMELAQ